MIDKKTVLILTDTKFTCYINNDIKVLAQKEKEDERSLVGWLWETPNFLVVRHLVQLNH